MKRVGIAELKSKLSENLRSVRSGETIIVMDRNTPVAHLTPPSEEVAPVPSLPPRVRYKTLGDIPLPPPLKTKRDIVEYLLEERGER